MKEKDLRRAISEEIAMILKEAPFGEAKYSVAYKDKSGKPKHQQVDAGTSDAAFYKLKQQDKNVDSLLIVKKIHESGPDDFIDLRKWWEYPKDKVMTQVYWLKRSLPPSDKTKYESQWEKIKVQLQTNYPIPNGIKIKEGFDTDLGAFRRMVITSTLVDKIEDDFDNEIKKLQARGEFLDLSVTYKKGVKPNTLVVDINGKGSTSIVSKFKPIIGKHDKNAEVKVKDQTTKVAVKEEVQVLSKDFGGYDDKEFLRVIWKMKISDLEPILINGQTDLKSLSANSRGLLNLFNKKDAQWVKSRIRFIKQVIVRKKKDPNYFPEFLKEDTSITTRKYTNGTAASIANFAAEKLISYMKRKGRFVGINNWAHEVLLVKCKLTEPDAQKIIDKITDLHGKNDNYIKQVAKDLVYQILDIDKKYKSMKGYI